MCTMNMQIPIVFNDPAYFATIDPEHLNLNYQIGPAELKQTRFKGRLIAKPTINLRDYEIKAEFDWIEIYIDTGKYRSAGMHQTQLSKLNDTIGAFSNCYVTDPNRVQRRSGSKIVVKMFDPQPIGLRLLLNTYIHENCDSAVSLADMQTIGFELSIDVYPSREFASEQAAYAVRRMLMTDLLRKHALIDEVFREGRRAPRFTFSQDGDPDTEMAWKKSRRRVGPADVKQSFELGIPVEKLAIQRPELHRQPYLDATWYYGKKGERLHFRCMDKITDRRTSAGAKTLDWDKSRSRIELIFMDEKPLDGLGPSSIDIRSLHDIGNRGLDGLNMVLNFSLPTFEPNSVMPCEPNPEEWEIFRRTGVSGLYYKQDVSDQIVGSPDALRAIARRGTFTSGRNEKFSNLNRRISKAMKRLSQRWARDFNRKG